MNEPHLLDALRAKQGHQPRTRYWSAAGKPKYVNTLILSDSPYLLQHAHNPVNWRPWSEEAFELAIQENKAIFLSIGYSTCHWCQVMERESFEDEEIAQLLNEQFVAIKVDREELPDVDSVYMDFLQITTGEGGWPMNVFLTPERRPLFASTYLPPRDGDRGVKLGLLTYLKVMAKSWQDPQLSAQGDAPLKVLSEYALQPPSPQLSPDWLEHAAQQWMEQFDEEWGGFSEPPKFLRPAMLEALLRAWHRVGDPSYLKAVEITLERLYCGGIYDHIGGGVSRYSVDNRWWVPHFEKMLYDNAQLVLIALETFQVTRRPLFSLIARDTLQFIERDLMISKGAWAAAIDAESLNERAERVEGFFYTWSYQELSELLDADQLEWVSATFGIDPEGNITQEDPSPQPPAASQSSQQPEIPLHGRNLLRIYEPLDEEEWKYWLPLRAKLHQARLRRPKPTRDEQVVCAWSALTLSAFSRASTILSQDRYLDIARDTAHFLTTKLWDGQTLKRVWRPHGSSEQQTDGVLEDYMALCLALIDFFEASGEASALEHAISIYEAAERFFDQERGGFFRCPPERRAQLPFEEKPLIDGAEPSGNALAALAALRLHQLTDKPHYRAQADSTLKAIGSLLKEQPTASPKALTALAHWFGGRGQLVITHLANEDKALHSPLNAAGWQLFQPYTTRLALHHIDDRLKSLLPSLATRAAQTNEAYTMICSARGCTPPITNSSTLRSALSQLNG